MLDANMKQQLGAYLDNLRNPISLLVAVDGSPKSNELEELAREIAELNDKISVSTTEDKINGRAPVMAIAKEDNAPRVFFAGIPLGHEFTSLVLALLQAGSHPSKEDQALQDQAKALTKELNFEVYVSLSCHNCPDVVQSINLMAALNPNITATMIDGGVFQEEVTSKDIMAVPALYLNGEPLANGKQTLADIINLVDDDADEKAAAALKDKDPFDVLVVGGGPAGASAAIYAARKGIRTGVVADRFGGQVADTVGIENFISVPYTEGPKLVAHLEEHVKEYDVDVMKAQKAVGVRKTDSGLTEVELSNGAVLSGKSVILATGARWREMNVPGEQEYRNKGVAYCPHCDGPLFKGKKVAVIGGGNSGIEAAIDLAGIVEHVTVLEFSDTLRADAVLVKKAESLPNVEIIKQAMTTEVLGDGQRVTGLQYKDRETDETHIVELAGIFVQIGLVPNTEFLKDTVTLTERGEVVIDDHGQTSIPGIFAAGDCTNVPYKQIIISMGAGATAALGAFDHLIRN
ncbi:MULTISPECIES: alkyl hydroperoxide reductase subunit F [Thalassolituus]|jgi:alkyl hydroperoxide reductase subunit F|uniref:Alkyl hydroperoxide reductase subunit F n=1 Tax=Thalassolituus maritimus TaxID=484498 RepID=A0A1N7MMB7_9GAMM|nr:MULTISPECIES: alkyl hydroperoxide reductase subunit F [Thalassolituus]MAX86170.1 alkyl hydroperoxide reductase subunit F [Oceanospirillaceae bacterium]MEC8908536.1 alkyl hydroperoxide reductase subunit F [Pseudomonadota bacterium]TPD55795.1 MAG: alkyl hydroperoxide reductase subunit F [Thalassolituus maritimus]SIS87071.1 alkyl hydroperoxide reductase subunit F [Thalassolituus maritimus]|tara:strand:- start:25818 stop:27371 length:1554 start_codon:yes stop_codon:yes gene_type:complete